MTLWDKGVASDADMMRYTARDDWQLDVRLVPHDLRASKAHVSGLMRIGVLAADECEALLRGLDDLAARWDRGAWGLSASDEDGHSAIESALVAALGEVGKKVHTGRSRNDQVLVALRLYERDAVDALIASGRRGALSLLARAEANALTPMPGYTHLQRAMPSTIGLWLSAVAESAADAIDMLVAVRALVDKSPLGGAAGYGVNLPLDRDGVARELGFSAVADNPLASQGSRGVVEVQICTAAWQLMAAWRRFAWDVSLFTTAEFGFVTLDASLTTGSSIMPQKRNPDIAELMRAASAVVQGAIAELMALASLPSGYHRDGQLGKAPLFRALDETLATSDIVPRLCDGMTFHEERMRDAIDAGCFATDRAIELTAQGVPFRDAYRQVAAEIARLERGDPEKSIAARTSPGGPGALRLDALRRRLEP